MKLRALIVSSFFYPHFGGAQQQALLLSAQLQRRGCQTAVLTRKLPGLKSVEMLHNVTVFRSIRTIGLGKLFGISYFLSCLWFMIRKRHNYDIVHCYILQGFHSLAAIVMKYLFGKKVIIRVSATGPLSDFLLLQQGLGGGFLLRCVRKADRIIILCNQSQQEALAAGFRLQQLVCIPNGVDTAVFSPSPQPAASGHILFVGRLDQMKRVEVLLKAVAGLRENGIRSFCTIVGDGPSKTDLQNYARSLAIDNQIVFTGACSDILPHLQQAAIFVLPSLSEGVPNVILEAMACGLPIIATAVGGIPDIIQNGRNGMLIAPDDVAALRSALAIMLTDADLAARLGKQARMDAENFFSLNKMTERYLELYRVITSQNS